jgi:hypothetical protein
MNKEGFSVPELDLAPQLNHPLRLWWPSDYLRLLYWAFFFPQAIRWYIERFGKHACSEEKNIWRSSIKLLRSDPIQRTLFFQSALLAFILIVVICLILQGAGLNINWLGIALWIALGSLVAIFIVIVLGVAAGVTVVVVGGVAFGVAFGVTLEVAFGIVFGVTFGIALGVTFGVAFRVAGGVAVIVVGGAAILVVGTILLGSAFGIVFGVTFVVAITRLLDYILLIIPIWISFRQRHREHYPVSRVTWLPLPGIQQCLQDWLILDSNRGIHNLNILLEYTLQFIPVMRAVDGWFNALSPEAQIVAADQLSRQPYDWGLARFGSAALRAAMWREATFFVPDRYLKRVVRFNAEPLLDTPAHAACAGYWYLHKKETNKAQTAFAHMQCLPHGATLYQSVTALIEAQQAKDLKTAAAWADGTSWLAKLQEEPLRPGAIATLRRLREVALEAQVAVESISKLNRSAALGRAVSTLTEMITDVKESCPDPEWPIVKEIAEQWRDVLSKAAGEIGQVAIIKPVTNPYVVGNPVTGKAFVGREEIFRRLEELWGVDASQRVPSVVLYGHRRMGKTSILQNLGHRFGVDTVVAYLTMQRVGRVANTGELLTTLALVLYDAISSANITTLDEPESTDFTGNCYTAFDRFLVGARRAIEARRVILTIDEFELVEKGINEKRIDVEVLDYLRGVIHSEPWLILALAGLHTLQEMTANYWNPLFASVTPVKVSFLTLGASAQLLANPTDDFPLDFTQETANRVFAWVRGQPYLTQLVGHTLVRRYNQLVFEDGVVRTSRFTPEDVDAVIDSSEFYEQGSYYFTGVWQQAEESGPRGQIALMRALAATDELQAPADLFARAKLDVAEGQASLEKLVKHDVVRQVDAAVDFAVPLMRKWLRVR